MRRAVRWLVRWLPPDYALALVVLFYLAVEGLAMLAAGNARAFLWPAKGAPVLEIFHVRDSVLIASAFFYGMWRVAAFHPFYRPAYSEWLKLMPWTSRHPLPAGPIHLAVQDLFAAGILMAAMHSTATPRQWVPALLLAGHSIAAGFALFWTGPRAIAYAVGVLLGIFVLALPDVNFALAAAVSTSLVAHGGIRSSLLRFPWEMPEAVARFFLGLMGRQAEMPKVVIGFPYEGLSPRPPAPPLPLVDGIALSLLPAWWAFTAIVVSANEEAAAVIGLPFMYLLPGLVVHRCVAYMATCRPPISLWGRIMTGRWIIPGYDRVFAAPVLAPIFSAGLLAIGLRNNIPLRFVVPACIAGMLLVTLNVGPSLYVWRLTGAYRLVPLKDRKNLIEL